jgi:fused signal recognition particle receptor
MFSKKEKPDEHKSFIKKLRTRLNKGKNWLSHDLLGLLPGGQIDEDIIENLELLLIRADVGIETTEVILDDLRKSLLRNELKDINILKNKLKESMLKILGDQEKPLKIKLSENPFVVFVVGVNGVGKTTTIGKITKNFKNEGYSVMLAAGDTFRAAAIEQLQEWGNRNETPVIAQQTGADPAAVIFDAWQAAKARGIEILIIDTAGRLQNQTGLMDELAKMKKVLMRHDNNAPHEIMLVIDSNQGQNALVQAKKFHETLGITGITVTKLDGTAKGGILLAIADQLSVDIRYIGIGENMEDMHLFKPLEFVNALISSDDES